MKLIEKLKGAHERPYVAYKVVGYYSSYQEAMEALCHVHTLDDVYHSWLQLHSLNVSPHTMKGYECAYHHVSSISHRPINEITYMELQNIISDMLKSGLSYSSCKKVRSLLNQLYSFAIINDWCSKSYSQYLNIGHNIPKRPRKVFTTNQINRLWSINAELPLILLYTGMRASELINLKSTDINRKQRYLKVTSSKTKAGIRIIPIHHRIWPFIESRLSNKWIIDERNYVSLSHTFKSTMNAINSQHTPHDCRHSFATRLDDVGANYNAKRLLLGHASSNVTDGVYTHKSLRQLRKAIEMLK